MQLRAVAINAVVFLSLCSPAGASVTIIDSNDQPVPRAQAWADSAAVPTPPATVRLMIGPCPNPGQSVGCAWPGTIWLDEGNPGLGDPRGTFLHELGHEYDYFAMTDERRAAFMAILHLAGLWRTAFDAPQEQFAEAYRRCAERARPRIYGTHYQVRGDLGFKANPAQWRQVCALIRDG